MRKIYTFILAFIIGITVIVAQTNIQKPIMVPLNGMEYSQVAKGINNKTVNCVDTIKYPRSKQTGLEELDPTPMDFATYISGTGQIYHLSNPGLIHGLTTYMLLDLDGIAGNTAPINIIIGVYNVANGYPTTVIELDTVLLSDVAYNYQKLMFNTPVAVSDSFVITIEIDGTSPSNPYYLTNTSANNDGLGESLSLIEDQASGTWINAFIDYAGAWDMDMLIAPIFSHDVTASFTEDTFNLCLGQAVTFTNTSSLNMDAMFNLMTGPAYTWNYDDGTGNYNHTDTSYTYGAPGFYRPTLYANYYGYSTTCVDSVTYPVVPNVYILVADTSATANFGWTDMGSGNFQFSDSSIVSGSGSYSWTFQGGIPATSNLINPTVTFATPGNYQVCLTVSDSTGCAIDMFCDSVSFTVGIDDYYASDYVKVFPIPANKHFYVTVPSNYYSGNVIITDVVGQRLKSIAIDRQEKVKVSTEGIASGVYFVSIDYNGERVFTKRIVIDR